MINILICKKGSVFRTLFALIGLHCFSYGLATAVIVAAAAAATTIVVGSVVVTATATAEDDEDEDYNPRTVITTKVTHLRKPPFLFSSHTMQKSERVLQKVIIFLFY